MFRRGLVVLKGKMAWAVSFVAVGTSCAVVGSYDFDGYRSELSGVGGGPMGTAGTTGSSGSSIDRDAAMSEAGTCILLTCQDLRAECGKVPDGCDGVLDCGTCEVGVCGGGGRNKCGADRCPPRNCSDLGASC